jgi:hypothetical protein
LRISCRQSSLCPHCICGFGRAHTGVPLVVCCVSKCAIRQLLPAERHPSIHAGARVAPPEVVRDSTRKADYRTKPVDSAPCAKDTDDARPAPGLFPLRTSAKSHDKDRSCRAFRHTKDGPTFPKIPVNLSGPVFVIRAATSRSSDTRCDTIRRISTIGPMPHRLSLRNSSPVTPVATRHPRWELDSCPCARSITTRAIANHKPSAQRCCRCRRLNAFSWSVSDLGGAGTIRSRLLKTWFVSALYLPIS